MKEIMKHTYYILYAVLGLFSLTSCSDFLDQPADERTEIKINSEKDEEKIVMLLNTAYPSGNYMWIAELSADNMVDNQCPHLPSNPNDKQILTHYNYGSYAKYNDELFRFEPAASATYSDYDSPGMMWSSIWSSVATCNYAIKAIDEWEAAGHTLSAKLRAARAEGKLLRAYNHFIAANLFCQPYKDETLSKKDIGLPYVTEPETELIVKYERGNVADLYKNIQKDLEDGLQDVNDLNYGIATKYHFNVNAAHAFAARFYLYTRQYDKVIEHANAVLGTNDERTAGMLLDYSKFEGCTYLDDFAHVWQDPEADNNIMLLCTNSILQRMVFGYRYSYAGDKCQESLMVRTRCPFWSGFICPPQAIVCGMLFSSSSSDYGFFSSKIGEEFEYTDKIAGIGYPHIVQRLFTCSELLLERAEAKIMTGQCSEGAQDIMLYWNSAYDSFCEKDKMAYNKNVIPMTEESIISYYSKGSTPNALPDWTTWTSQVSPSFVVPEDAVPYMNCVNDIRRYETSFEGLRFFDLKRWGLTYKHTMGLRSDLYISEASSDVRALELPWESIASGLEKSRNTVQDDPATSKMTLNKNAFVYKSK